tara:strand:- start:4950 stop:6740 length:1791 start_codon:yes stop_codon:yes gene_type:complete
MTNILSFDSIYILKPLRKYYLRVIKALITKKSQANRRLILYRLDQENIFIRDKRNISGNPVGMDAASIDVLSIKFYRYLQDSHSCNAIQIKNEQLYSLYTRQVKLKLAGLLKCAFRIKSFSGDDASNLEIIADRQTIAIMKETFLFLGYSATNFCWRSDNKLTICITLNSIMMRAAALLKMIISSTTLPKYYFAKHISDDAPSLAITTPRRRPEDFFTTYLEQLDKKFNLYIFSVGFLSIVPDGYRRVKIKRKIGVLRGFFKLKYLCFSSDSYIADILLIFKNHSNLSISIDAVRSLLENKIDVHVSRLQTNVLDNYLSIEARRKKIFILGDIMEEVFYCDAAICSSKHEFTPAIKLALNDYSKITFKGTNSNINYRIANFKNNQDHYLHQLLSINYNKKIVFYASDPSKEESQRYLTEKFLFNYFSKQSDFIFIIKTHTQDKGRITNYAYIDAGEPSNVFLIGDVVQKKGIASDSFYIFNRFDFNLAIATSDIFLTTSSSSILQALMLGCKSGIVDLFNNGFYGHLIEYKVAKMINSEIGLTKFLNSAHQAISESALQSCGLKNENGNQFNLEDWLLASFDKRNQAIALEKENIF